jgi:hypothetical protein
MIREIKNSAARPSRNAAFIHRPAIRVPEGMWCSTALQPTGFSEFGYSNSSGSRVSDSTFA